MPGRLLFTVPRTITVEEDGVKIRKQINKPIKTWYWRDSIGQVRFSVRISNKRIELDKSKSDIVVGEDEKLPQVVATVLKAVEAGELRVQLYDDRLDCFLGSSHLMTLRRGRPNPNAE